MRSLELSESMRTFRATCRPTQRGVPVDQAVTTAVVLVALHVNTLSGGRLGRSRIFIMAIGNGVPIRAVEVRVMSGYLCKVSVSGAA